MTAHPIGRLLCVGLRGAEPGDPVLEHDLEACSRAGVGAIILFDVDVPTFGRMRDGGLDREGAMRAAPRNVLGADQLRRLIDHVRQRLGRGLWVGIDQEGGRVARLSPRRGFDAEPSAEEFSRLDPSRRAAVAARSAARLRDLGIDLNFAPCVDLALEPENAIITRLGRAYGSDPHAVVDAVRVVLDAHAAAGVAACLKHFPGHGSSRGDTHAGLVDITATWQRDAELAPYRVLLTRPGVAVMVAHVVHRDLDPQRPASLSPNVIGGLLREEIGFEGLVVTDSLDMHAITERWSVEEAVVAAVDAGVDLVIDGFNLDAREEHPAPRLADALIRALRQGRIAGGEDRVQRSLRRAERLRREISASAGDPPR